ncbi:MAG: DUF624 domain-containing protein [Candidatus Eisenbacteria bacterium]|nr:DUF624 domain-containing protein [Candidatus Eisenbacteria bacterium]
MPKNGRPEPGGTRAGPTRIRAADVLRPTFKRAFWHAYDHLGTLIVANLLWCVLCLGVVTAPPATAGLFSLARRIAADEDARLADFWVGFRRDLIPSIKLGAFTAGAAALLWFNIRFYGRLHGRAAFAGTALATLLVWSAAFFALMHVHLHPLLSGGDRRLRTALRKSALLALDNPGFTIVIALQSALLVALLVASGVGLLLLAGSLTAVILSTGHRELLKKYFPGSDAASEAPETRSWRDLWRPWESQRPR